MHSFECPHCKKQHVQTMDRCPETGEPISEVHKLTGVVLADRYRLERRVSEGGMGVVYEAKHVKLGRRVAVKMLHPHLRVSADTMKRFENEARLAASVGHRAIVDVIDLGRHAGLPYFVMEYLEGEGLNEVLEKRGSLPIGEAVDIVIEMLEGLRAVHEKGIVHRDLKPGNVMLAKQPGGTVAVKILDFGICRLQSEEASQLHVTKTGSVFGTPRYMSPEQAQGLKDIDSRADLYSAGVILFRMVTGGFPFSGDNYNALLNAIATKEPVPPRRLKDTIPDGLEAIILRALSKRPDDRYKDASAFMEALAPYASAPTLLPAGRASRAQERMTLPAPPPVDVAAIAATVGGDGKTRTSTSWDSTSGKGRRLEATWLLPASIVLLLALSGISAVALVMHSRFTRQAREMSHMQSLVSGSEQAKKALPASGGPAAPSDPGATPAAATGPAAEPSTPAETEEPPADGATVTRALLEIKGLPAGAVVTLDGVSLPALPAAVDASNETRKIRIEAAGYLPWEGKARIAEDTILEVTMIPYTQAPAPIKKGKDGTTAPPIDTKYPGMVEKKPAQ